MKKEMNQKVNLSKKAKKVLAGTLAASMVFSGSMTSFIPETVNADDSATATGSAFNVLDMNEEQNGAKFVEEIGRKDVLELGKPGDKAVGVEVENPFAGNYDLAETMETAYTNSGLTFSGLVSDATASGKIATFIHQKLVVFTGFSEKNGIISTKTTDCGVATTKADAIAAYNTALANMQAATADAIKYLELEATSGSGVHFETEGLKKIAQQIAAEEISPESVLYLYYGPQRNNENPTNPAEVSGEFCYPLPVWNTGVSVSTWVKVDEDAEWTAPIFSFVDGKNGLTLRTDGQFIFAGEQDSNSKNNVYSAEFEGHNPYDNKGEWVYVTLTVKNDEVNVYYNGEKAKEVLNKNITKAGKNGSKSLCGGFGIKAHGDDATRIASLLKDERYPQLLENFEKGTTDFSDVSNYSYPTTLLMMDLITNSSTQLYIGGDDGTALSGNWNIYIMEDGNKVYNEAFANGGSGDWSYVESWAAYTKNSAKMQISDMTTMNYPVDSVQAAVLYNIATPHVEEAFAEYDEYTSDNVVDANASVNNAVTGVAGGVGNVYTFGAIDEDAEAADIMGVSIKNPFAGQFELVETAQQAFENNGTVFNGITYLSNDSTLKKDYMKVATTMNSMTSFYYNKGKVNLKDGNEKESDSSVPFVNKAAAQKAYDTVKNRIIDEKWYGATGVAAQMAAGTTNKGKDVTTDYQNQAMMDYTNKLIAITSPESITADVVHYTYNGPARGGSVAEPNSIKGEFAYPIPEWKTGVTVSTWVRVPEAVSGANPIFTFAADDGKCGLVLRTDGTLIYLGNAIDRNPENYFSAMYKGGSPYENKGEWVYVTLSMKNDGFNVYYNGVEATQTVSSKITLNSTPGKTFNYGFGWAGADNRLAGLLNSERDGVTGILKNFAVDETDYSDFSKYWAVTSRAVMELLTEEGTELYLGGAYEKVIYSDKIYNADGVNKDANGDAIQWGQYSAYAEGMQIGPMTFHTKDLSAIEAARLYQVAVVKGSQYEEPETPEAPGTETPGTETPGTETPGTETPGTDKPGTETPGTDKPGTEAPGTDKPDAPVSPAPSAMKGDLNDDKTVDLKDAKLALEGALKIIKLKDVQIAAGDIDGNGTVELADAKAILEAALKIKPLQ